MQTILITRRRKAFEHVKKKAIQKGNDVTHEFIMSIARAEVSTKYHLSLIKETSPANVNFLRYGTKRSNTPNMETSKDRKKRLKVASTNHASFKHI